MTDIDYSVLNPEELKEAVTAKALKILKGNIEDKNINISDFSESFNNIEQEISDQKSKEISKSDNNILFLHLTNDLGLDSLSVVELIMEAEEAFDCDIDDETAENLQNTMELIDLIVKLILDKRK